MENIGQTLKARRTALDLSIQQVADKTKVRANVIADLEENYTEHLETPYIAAFTNTLQNCYNIAESNENYLQDLKSDTNAHKKIARKKPITNQYERPIDNINNSKTVEENSTNDINQNVYNEDMSYVATTKKESDWQQNVTESDESKYVYDFETNRPQTNRPAQKISRNRSISAPKVYFTDSLNITSKEIATYISLAIFLFLVVFFVFIYDENTFDFLKKTNVANATQKNNNSDSVLNIEQKDDDLFSFFDKPDSIVLRAVCHDTAWVKVVLDGKKTDEMLMLPATDNSWSASEQIVLATSNVGNISFYKNDTLLPKLGTTGTMVKNIVITSSGISNVTPLTTGDTPVPINDLPGNINTVNPTVSNSTKQTKPQRPVAARRKKEVATPLTIIDISKPNINKSPILEDKKTTQETEETK